MAQFEDIISKSDQVDSGSPSVYQLRTKKQKSGSLTLTVGEKQETKPNKTILLVGETATGKSTLVNALFNYAVGVKFGDDVWFQLVEDQTGSQTSDVIVYQIFGFEDQTLPFSLTIIDTPAFGDTQDPDHIRTNQRLMELFQSADGIQEVHAVGLVMKDEENPVTDQLKNIYDFIKSQFGKDVKKNIIALMTNSQGKPPRKVLQALEAANIKCAKNEKNQPCIIQFDNCQDEERTEESELSIENAWKVTERGMKQFIAFLEKSPPLQPEVILEHHKERIRLTACIQNLLERIRFTELKMRDVERTQEALRINNQKMKRDKSFNVSIPEAYKDLQPPRDGRCSYETSLCCPVCKENCHYPGCTKALNPEQCEVMIDGKCTSCTNKCPASDHVKQNRQCVIRTNKVEKTKEALKKQEDEMERDINFSMEVDEVYKEKEPIRGGKWGLVFLEGAVTCSVCEENCHYPGCTMAQKPAHCEVIKNGHCTVCTNKCPASVHVKENWSYVTKTRKVQKTLEAVKEKYDQNKAECENKSTLLENLEKETNNLTVERSELLDEAYSHVIRLEQIALKVDSVSTLVHLDFLIEKMKEKGDQEKVKKLEKMKIRIEK
ncbi:uncharacterized protein LOC106956753 isoform X1 [Poecilia latipinna]|uniref:uncharacterized protein LOC106956753 isoform X1 n=1 Tax=Poecilia latipinna TaxID=48699 RepID=UPI00072DE62D|nr:PREDICTED: uncharacterized protein LOC106956753 isoform X1 [Poecilia latipinna]